MKVTSHHVRSPLEMVAGACQTCHRDDEDEIRRRVAAIQRRTTALTERAAAALTDMLDAILEARATGASDAQLAEVFELQKKAMWRLDFISSENSKGFHADQESARILAESIDYSRQAQAQALRLRAPAAPSIEGLPRQPVQGVTAAAPDTEPASPATTAPDGVPDAGSGPTSTTAPDGVPDAGPGPASTGAPDTTP